MKYKRVIFVVEERPEENKKAFNIVDERHFQEQVNDLFHALEKKDIIAANGIIRAMAINDNKLAVEPLTVLLEYQDETIQVSSAMALGKLGDSLAVQPLLKAAADPSEKVSLSAVAALGMIGDKSALTALESIVLSPEQPHMMNAVRSAIFKINHPGDTHQVAADGAAISPPAQSEPAQKKSSAHIRTPEQVVPPAPEEPAPPVKMIKSPFLAAIASLFLPGLGQVYTGGRYWQGLKYLLGTIFGIICLIFPGMIIWLYGIWDAYKTANKINTGKIQIEKVSAGRLILYALLVIAVSFIIWLIVALAITALISGSLIFGSINIQQPASNTVPVVAPPHFDVIRVNSTTIIFTMDNMGGASSVQGFNIQQPSIADPMVIAPNNAISLGQSITVTDSNLSGPIRIVATSLVDGSTEVVFDQHV
jgi:HEAT repeats